MISFFYPPQPIRLWPNSDYFLKLSNNPNWDAETKYNGWRLLIFKTNNRLQFFNRHNTIIDINTKIFNKFFEKIPNDTIFDAELINFRSKDFKNIIVVFDVPFYNNKDLRKEPLTERRKYNHFLTAPDLFTQSNQDQIYSIKQQQSNFLNFYNMIIKRNLSIEEGLVLKRKESIYQFNNNRSIDTTNWIKVKKAID